MCCGEKLGTNCLWRAPVPSERRLVVAWAAVVREELEGTVTGMAAVPAGLVALEVPVGQALACR